MPHRHVPGRVQKALGENPLQHLSPEQPFVAPAFHPARTPVVAGVSVAPGLVVQRPTAAATVSDTQQRARVVTVPVVAALGPVQSILEPGEGVV